MARITPPPPPRGVPVPEMEGRYEALIAIGGVPLTASQSLAVRMAITFFIMSMREPSTAEEYGATGANCVDRLQEVLHLMRTAGGLV